MFCASLAPANIACANKALDIMKRDETRQKNLLAIAKHAREGLKKHGIKFREGNITPIITIYTYQVEKTFVVCKELFDNGVYVNPVIPPATPEGECLIRISFMATHTEELIDKAVDTIAEVFKKLDV